MSSKIVKERAIVLSVKPRWANLILSGKKTVELRRRFAASLSERTSALLYASAPLSAVVGMITIEKVLQDKPEQLWTEVEHLIGVDHCMYSRYFAGAMSGTAIFLCEPKIMAQPLPLARLREDIGFSPPVSWRWAKPSECQLIESIKCGLS